jgi:hypothetical protein
MTSSFTTMFTVDQSPDEVFAAISNVDEWWGPIEGSSHELGAEFTYRYKDVHRSTQQVTEFVPGSKITWHVVEGYLKFVQDTAEWTGTDITFDISAMGDKTEVRFTHVGLVPEGECFDSCSICLEFLHQLQSSEPDHYGRRCAEIGELGCDDVRAVRPRL